jgi:hypothetical protein
MSVYITTSDTYEAAKEALGWLNRGIWKADLTQPNIMYPSDAVALILMEWTTSYELRELTVNWERTPSVGVVQDRAMTTHHFLNITGGLPDASWITADYTAVETAFDTLWTNIKNKYSPAYKLAEYVWRADGPAFRPFGTSLAPTLRRTARNVVGTSATEALPPQCAISVTETTSAKFTVEDVEGVGTQLRNRWGRFYLPAITVDNVTNGRITNSSAQTISDQVQTAYNACAAAGIFPVMYSPTTGHAWSVLEVHVDDIFDVIRSRRYITPISRHVNAITQP